MNKKNITGKKIRLIRMQKGITQEQLAARLHVQGINMDRSNIPRIEHQTRELLDYEIKAIAIALDTSIEDLFDE
ncbi:helix-turn-helix domain-containing protein [Clostridium magnum]|uniref:Helix-turn-helix domain protein n=1 Tax=Clostridium magnum DSM 2767 TaxID=1121326 RepID=A0A162R487_9CLOT|nr:helix-turn-helix transcriptional regulator [Clostridium magnum]KZL89399.1 helix-turn-helix domain protein [Clostridium magnum DSM 2767]SHI20670.1 Helix-turn-helix domain-containing protein [Clostridium magnum DSM 2767]